MTLLNLTKEISYMSIKDIEDFYIEHNIDVMDSQSSLFPPLQYEVPSAYENSELIYSDSSVHSENHF